MDENILSNEVAKCENGVGDECLQGVTAIEAAKILIKSCHGRRNIDDSFYIYDAGDVARRYKRWVELFPLVKPYYAVKSAPHPPLIKYLGSVGAGYDCASQKEMDMVLEAGVDPSDIVFSNATKQASHIAHAKSVGVNLTVFDSEGELHKMKNYFPEAKLLVRIWTDGTGSLVDLSVKFGVRVAEACRLLQVAKDLQLSVVGVCFHVGSACTNPKSYISALKDTKTLFEYSKSIGVEMNVVNIGGGFPGVERKISLKQIAAVVNENLNEYFPSEQYTDLQIIAEPGRYFAATPFTLVTNVLAKKGISRSCTVLETKSERLPHERSDLNFLLSAIFYFILFFEAMKGKSKVEISYTLNAGKFSNFFWFGDPSTPTEEMEPFPLKLSDNKKMLSEVYGPTCDCDDIVSKSILLPEMEIGDWMIWKNAGAYSFSMSTGFNGFQSDKFYTIYSEEN